MNDQKIEEEIQSKGLTSNRVTSQRIEDVQVTVQYYVFPGTTVTVCCITLKNGFSVIGESACASKDNFDADIGMKIALKNAQEKIWPLEGYALCERLSA